jgi:hypothetical protein
MPLTPAQKRAREQIRRGHKPDARQLYAIRTEGHPTLRSYFERRGQL